MDLESRKNNSKNTSPDEPLEQNENRWLPVRFVRKSSNEDNSQTMP